MRARSTRRSVAQQFQQPGEEAASSSSTDRGDGFCVSPRTNPGPSGKFSGAKSNEGCPDLAAEEGSNRPRRHDPLGTIWQGQTIFENCDSS
jgi:hypothetical protein